MPVRWKIVDEHGADVMTADSVDRAAELERKTPRQIAQREARLLVNVEAGDAPVFAVRAQADTETGVTYWDVNAELDRLRALNAKLLAALKAIRDLDDDYCENCKSSAICRATGIAVAAILKAGGAAS